LYAGIDDRRSPPHAARPTRRRPLVRDYRGDVATLAPDERAEASRYEAIVETATKVESFAHLIWSTDTANPRYGGLLQKATEWSSQLQQKLVFFTLEWVNAPDHVAHRLIEAPELAHYRHWLEVARLYQPHMLSEAEEKILAEKSVTGREAWVRFFTELRGSARYTLDGQSLNESAVLARLYDADREVRRRAAAALTEGLRAHLPMTTFIFNTLAADKASDDRLRRYPTWIAARNLSNEVSDETVEALIAAVTGRYDIVARYYTLKRRILGLDELTDYDRYAPLPAAAASYRWDEARETVLQAYGAFTRGASIAGQFFSENWIDAAERPKTARGQQLPAPSRPNIPMSSRTTTGRVRD